MCKDVSIMKHLTFRLTFDWEFKVTKNEIECKLNNGKRLILVKSQIPVKLFSFSIRKYLHRRLHVKLYFNNLI